MKGLCRSKSNNRQELRANGSRVDQWEMKEAQGKGDGENLPQGHFTCRHTATGPQTQSGCLQSCPNTDISS